MAHTAVTIVINDANQALLLLRGATAPFMPLKWGLPGGEIEKGESGEQAAIRETREEANIHITNPTFICETNQVLFYSARGYTGQVELKPNWDETSKKMIIEHDKWAWVSAAEVDSYDILPGYKIPETIKAVLNQPSKPTNINSFQFGVLIISDSRKDFSEDKSGALLKQRIESAGHKCSEAAIVIDNIYAIRAQVSQWIASSTIQVIVTTGGTGLTGRDVTPEAITPLLDKTIDGFGEMFRTISYQEIGCAGLQSRALAGSANGKLVFCLPGSPSACATAWDKLINDLLNPKTKGCSLGKLLIEGRLAEK